jgi:hypothetical protein
VVETNNLTMDFKDGLNDHSVHRATVKRTNFDAGGVAVSTHLFDGLAMGLAATGVEAKAAAA